MLLTPIMPVNALHGTYFNNMCSENMYLEM